MKIHFNKDEYSLSIHVLFMSHTKQIPHSIGKP